MKIVFAAILALALVGCEDPYTIRRDAPSMPKIEGCTIERHLVKPTKESSTEVLYIAKCKPTESVSTSMTRNCGKNCTQRITTTTITEGVPDAQEK